MSVVFIMHINPISIIVISGEATEIIEGEEIQISVNEAVYVPAGEKHGIINKTDKNFHYLEFFTAEASVRDFIEVSGEKELMG